MIAVVCALKEEFITSKVPVLYTGIGKIQSAVSLTEFIHDHPEIDHYINFGTAGGIRLDKGHIVECTTFTNGDIALDYSCKVHNIPTISFSKKGDHAVCFDTFKSYIPNGRGWDCVDMESYSLAFVCNKFNKKFSCYKYISDKIGEKSQLDVWEQNVNRGATLFNKILNTFI
mgnify:CR=1 FL=1